MTDLFVQIEDVDRSLAPDIEAVRALIESGRFTGVLPGREEIPLLAAMK